MAEISRKCFIWIALLAILTLLASPASALQDPVETKTIEAPFVARVRADRVEIQSAPPGATSGEQHLLVAKVLELFKGDPPPQMPNAILDFPNSDTIEQLADNHTEMLVFGVAEAAPNGPSGTTFVLVWNY